MIEHDLFGGLRSDQVEIKPGRETMREKERERERETKRASDRK